MSTVESPESARTIGEFLLSTDNGIRRAIDRLNIPARAGDRADDGGERP